MIKSFITEYYYYKLAKIREDQNWITKGERVKRLNNLYSWIIAGVINEDTFLHTATEV